MYSKSVVHPPLYINSQRSISEWVSPYKWQTAKHWHWRKKQSAIGQNIFCVSDKEEYVVEKELKFILWSIVF